MKTSLSFLLAIIVMICLTTTSCRSHRAQKTTSNKVLPPGHAKKLFGHQSAKAFAPGQQKQVVRKKKKRG